MLNILSTILNWSEDDREKAGLQKSLYGSLGLGSPGGRRKMPRIDSNSSTTSSGSGGGTGVDTSESFSNMWVEFLMKEASQGTSSSSIGSGSGHGSRVKSTGTRRPSTAGGVSDSGLSTPGLGLGGMGGLLSPRSPRSEFGPTPLSAGLGGSANAVSGGSGGGGGGYGKRVASLGSLTSGSVIDLSPPPLPTNRGKEKDAKEKEKEKSERRLL